MKLQERSLQDKIDLLNEKMQELTSQNVCIAFSGGVDSSLLLYLAGRHAREQNTKVYAVTFDTELHPSGDLAVARKIARDTHAEHVIIHLDELENPRILENPPDRCYLCKRMLFEKLMDFAREHQVQIVMEGTNQDDRKVYRPGLRAIEELGVLSPLEQSGFTKEDVRAYASRCGLQVSKRPSTPCLATRLPYYTRIDRHVLSRIEAGEQYLRDLGYYNVRLRVHGEILRIEVDRADFEKMTAMCSDVAGVMKKLGFSYVTLDLEGFRSGSMDEKLVKNEYKGET